MNALPDSIPVFIYFIAAGASPIKIGLATNPEVRLAELQIAHYKQLHLLFTIQCIDRAAAFEVETAFHRWYADVHLRGEWYDVTPQKIAADIKLLSKLAGLITNIQQIVSAGDLARLEDRAELKFRREGSNRASPKLTKALEYLQAHPDELTTPSRQLESVIGVNHVTIKQAQNQILQSGGAMQIVDDQPTAVNEEV